MLLVDIRPLSETLRVRRPLWLRKQRTAFTVLGGLGGTH